MTETSAERAHPVMSLREWLAPGTLVQLLTVLVCLVLAWGNVTNRLDYAEQKITTHETRLTDVEKQVEAARMEAERGNTQLEKRLAEIPAIKVQISEIDRKIERLLAQKEIR